MPWERSVGVPGKVVKVPAKFEFAGMPPIYADGNFNGFHSFSDAVQYASLLWSDITLTAEAADKSGRPLTLTRAESHMWSSYFSWFACHGPNCTASPFSWSEMFQVQAPSTFGGPDQAIIRCSSAFSIWYPAALCLGAVLFLSAGLLASSAVFHYALGVVIGLAVLLAFLWRRPRLGGASAFAALAAVMFSKSDMASYMSNVARMSLYATILLVVVASFTVVYVVDPTSNARLCVVIRRALEFLGLCLVAVSTADFFRPGFNVAVSLATLIMPFVFTPMLRCWSATCSRCRRWVCGKPIRKVFTRDEALERMRIATEAGKEELREQIKRSYADIAERTPDREQLRRIHDFAFLDGSFTPDLSENPLNDGCVFDIDDEGARIDDDDVDSDDLNQFDSE